jgi:uncharacterized protein DUF1501
MNGRERRSSQGPHVPLLTNRREFLLRAGGGFGALALAALLDRDGLLGSPAAAVSADPLTPKPPHLPPRAKSVIWLFMEGGPSHLDLFDPKPALAGLAGQPLPASFGRPITAMGTTLNALMPSKRTFRRYGRSGIEVSDWYPKIAEHVDDLAVIRSCWADGLNHVGSVCQMNTGSILAGRPSMGAWVTYGLGSSNEDLPAFVILLDDKSPIGGPKNWSAGFLPANFQGTPFRTDGVPILNLAPPDSVGQEQQQAKFAYLTALNRRFDAARPEDTELDARIQSYELAFRMQTHAPEAVDLSKESPATRQLYGMDDKLTEKVGRNCLLARRLVERGVRFVQVYCGTGSQWDAHTDLEGNHSKMCAMTDRPIAGLLADLKSRGLLGQTLVVWGGEFGRTPMSEKGKGRDHNPYGFTMWMTGGGVKGGQVIGTTDEIGLRAVESRIHVHDLHATILYMLGLDHLRLTIHRNGRDERPTVNGGQVVRQLIA